MNHTDDQPYRVVVAAGLQLFRAGLRCLVQSQRDFDVVGEASDGHEARSFVRAEGFDLLLLDLALPGLSTQEVLRELPRESARAIVLSQDETPAQLVDAVRAGASGIVEKDATLEHLLRAMRAVVAGEMWAAPESVSLLVRGLLHEGPDSVGILDDQRPQDLLTPREKEIVRHVAEGAANRAIAQRFGLQEQTVKNHLSSIYNKLGVSSRLELAVHAMHHRILDDHARAPARSVVSVG